MKKQLLFIVLFACATTPLFATRIGGKPTFNSGYIQMATRAGLCGGVTFVPDPNYNVRVVAQRFDQGVISHVIGPVAGILSKPVELPMGGLRVAYDWAGIRPSYHYRVYCQVQNERGNWVKIDCSKVVMIDDVKHNWPCVSGPAGPSAKYDSLNMKRK